MQQINFDSQQQKLRLRLQKIASKLEDQNFLRAIFFDNALKSLYIQGSAGCGKTTLMREFYDSLKKTAKIYFHFNSFMLALHQELHAIRHEKKKYDDELIEAVDRIIGDKKLICFDEFQVLDIADAMLLSRIFSYLFKQKIIVIFTSNEKPLELYKNGLQREIFLEFVDKILLKNCEVFAFENAVDYRALHNKNLAKRYFVSNKNNRQKIRKIIADFTKRILCKPKKIKVWARDVVVEKSFGKIAIFNFDELCRADFAASDYKAIAQEFDLIFLLKLPILTKQDPNETRRFTLFIDEIYENKTALIILAKTKIDKIFAEDNRVERAISRLKEIKSDRYWLTAKYVMKKDTKQVLKDKFLEPVS